MPAATLRSLPPPDPSFDNAEVYCNGKAEEVMGQAIKVRGAGAPGEPGEPSQRAPPQQHPSLRLPASTASSAAPLHPCTLQELGWKRSDLVLSTKIFWGGQGPNDKGLSRKRVVEGLRASLQRLQVCAGAMRSALRAAAACWLGSDAADCHHSNHNRHPTTLLPPPRWTM